MSGGSWGYLYSKVDDAADRLNADHNPKRRALGRQMHKLAKALRAVEWNDSGDGDKDEAALIDAVVTPAMEAEAATSILRAAIADAQITIERLGGGQ